MRSKHVRSAALLAAGLAFGSAAWAEEKPAAPAPAAEAPKPPPKAWKPKPAKPKLPVSIQVTATSPDPPWLLRIENTGASPIRIPADARLLSFELRKSKKAQAQKCALPKAMVPSTFPKQRELYLAPGQVYEEQIDPRLYCFGDAIDSLRPGAVLKPTFGFGPGFMAQKEPFAAQGTDRPEAFEPLKQVVGAELVLPVVVAPPSVPKAEGQSGGAPASAGAKSPEAKTASAAADPNAPIVDRNQGKIDIYVSRTSDAAAPRDVVSTIRAVNEGGRQLSAVLRGRMLHFTVEHLASDNTAISKVECRGQDAAHGVATEMVSQVKPGNTVSISLLLAEVCPKGTFPKPGLYRVTPVLDASMTGESLKLDPWLGKALGLQPTLARVATAREPFYDQAPKAGPFAPPKPKSAPDPKAASMGATNASK